MKAKASVTLVTHMIAVAVRDRMTSVTGLLTTGFRATPLTRESESGLQSKLRLKSRLGAMNSLGSPQKSKDRVGQQAPPAAPGLMVFGGDHDLKMWTIGTANFKQGLNSEAYRHHKQAVDNHMQHKGKMSERSY